MENQYSLKKVLERFDVKAKVATERDSRQIDGINTYTLVDPRIMSQEQERGAMKLKENVKNLILSLILIHIKLTIVVNTFQQ